MNSQMSSLTRCSWCGTDPLYIDYHDKVWGVPMHDDQQLFEMLCLEGAQAGLSWITILRKRENYLEAFDNFDPGKVARYTDQKLEKILKDPGIVRNRLKVYSVRTNAQSFLETLDEFGSFDTYIWQFTGGKTITNTFKTLGQLPASTSESDAMSKDLKKRGFKFVGSTICYAFMQATGMVNDHITSCFRYDQVSIE